MRKSVTGILSGTLAVAAVSGGIALASSPAGASAVPACGNHSLKFTHTQPQGARGHSSFIVRFKNVGYGSCSLYGYPGFDALGSYGAVLKHAKRTMNGFTGGASSIKTIVVRPGHFASADVEWTNFKANGDACRWSEAVATTPPNTSRTVTFPLSVSLCRLQVHATVAGKSGNS